MQINKKLKPVSVNTDTSKLLLKESEATFLKGYELSFDKNTGSFGVGKKMPSNYQTIVLPIPAGINKDIGFFENPELNEAYVFRWNSNTNFNIYRLDGLTMQAQMVYTGPSLGFSIDPKHSIPDHRVMIRVVYNNGPNGEKKVKEKYLIFTNGLAWQKWISVLSGIATNGFNATSFPYYNLHTPHFDADELVDYAVRPPMYAPVITPVAPQVADRAKPNLLLDKSIQFAYRYIMTDGRSTALSWYSEPYFNPQLDCSMNDGDSPRCLDLQLYAGSALVERIQILTRLCNGDWELYDTIDRFDTDGANNPATIGDEYWKRTNQWAKFAYNFSTNTITYRYCGDLGTSIFSPSDGVLFVQNDIPLKSIAVTSAGDDILWGDNLYYYPNISDATLNNIELDVVDTASGGCVIHDVSITLYAIVCENARFNVPVIKNGSSATQRYISSSFELAGFFDLTLNSRDGLVCYLAGTSYFSIGKQCILEADGTISTLGVLDFSLQSQIDLVTAILARGALIVQQFEFNVPAGNYVARLTRHNADLNTAYQKISTYVMGLVRRDNMDGGYGGFANFNDIQGSNFATDDKEFRITAMSDYNSLGKSAEMFYVYTPYWETGKPTYVPGGGKGNGDPSRPWRLVEGYVQEDNVEKIGVELVSYYVQLGDTYPRRYGFFTDCNGFYFAYGANGDAYKTEIAFSGRLNCSIQDPVFTTNINKHDTIDRGWYPNTNISLSDKFGGSVGFANYVLIKGKITSCVTGQGIPGIGVTFDNTQTYYTNSDGEFEIHYHIFYTASRNGKLHINSSGKCVFTECDCAPLITYDIDGNTVPCTGAHEQIYPVDFQISIKASTQTDIGLKGGGKYAVYGIGHDLAGRKTFANLIDYVDIPTFLEKGNFAASKIRWTLSGALNLPPDIKWWTFAISKNLVFSEYLQWVGDKIQFLDPTGAVVPDGNGAIRAKITIQSLLDFNNLYNFATTVSYQFVDGDRLRIYDNGQGDLFDPATNNGFLDFRVLGTDFNATVATPVEGAPPVDGKSFIIDFDTRLLALKDTCGFWIELNRPLNTIDKTTCFGITGTYPVINGEIGPTGTTGTLNAFDTYLQQRTIVIPGCSSTNFNHPFESNSITDFFGKGCDSSGAAMFRDQLAQQRWYPNDVMRADSFLNEGRVNGLGTCRTANRKEFKDQTWGGIIIMKAGRNVIYIICQNDWFMTDFDMNYARVDGTGKLITDPDQNIGTPHPKDGDSFGCEYEDTATAVIDDGRIYFADRKNSAVVIITKGRAFDLSEEDNKNYFVNKFKYLVTHNNGLNPNDPANDLMEIVAGTNPYNTSYHITFRKRAASNPSPVKFVNNEREIHIDRSETFIYNPILKKWTSFAGFIPEFYGKMKHAATGEEMIAFAAGSPWFHNSKATVGYNKFFDIRTDQIITVVASADPSKLQVFQRAAIESPDVKYFIYRIATDDPGLFSYVPLNYFRKKGQVYYSRLLRNMNTYPDPGHSRVSMLVDGNSITGNYAEFTFVADTNRQEDYSQVNNILIGLIGSEKSDK